MDIPNEIILQILKSLEKSDLKSARLVSKTWTAFAAELLFDQVYVSVHPDNLEVFKAITQHALLSKCVKTLRYDAVDFIEDYKMTEYAQDLWRQTRGNIRTDQGRKTFGALSSDPEINKWIDLVVTHGVEARSHIRTYKDYKFIHYGHRKYQWYAALQRSQPMDGNFVETLVRGLQKLKTLSRVTVDDRWPFPREVLDDPKKLFLRNPTGSPLARNWSMFHTSPHSWNYGPNLINEPRATDGADHYWAITCALIRSQRRIQTFEVREYLSHGIPPYVFDRSQSNTLSSHGLDIVAFSGLKVFRISIAPYGDEKTPQFFPNMDGLRFLLGSMHHLEFLELNHPGEHEDRPTIYTYTQIFPKEGLWNQLTTLSLHYFASSAMDFLVLLTRRTPNLVELRLGMVELLTGTWEGVIECMTQSMHLLRFDIMLDAQFLHRGGTEFFSKNYADPDEIEEYVENGGRHPCLRSDQPDSAAQKYVTDELECFCKAVHSALIACA